VHLRHIVCTAAFAGVERYVTYVAAEQARRGHRVEVIGGEPQRMRAELAGSGVVHIGAPTARAGAWANLRRPRPDLVHSHMTAADAAAALTRPLVRRPLVSTLHFAQPRGHSATTRLLYRGLRPLLSAEVAISATVAGAAGGHPTVILNGVPAPTGPPPDGAREPVVLVVQRLEREKHTSVALRAFAASGLAAQGWQLHVLGDGEERPALERLAGSVGLAEAVRFAGPVDDVTERLAVAGLLLAPRPDEPFGLAVVEAMAAGTCVVAADGGAHRETVGRATPDTLFPPGDVDTAAALLQRLATDPAARSRHGHAARRHHEAELTIERHVDHLDALYERVLHRR
jgi:glycosyltransferase involved in cell wall biosynthesis